MYVGGRFSNVASLSCFGSTDSASVKHLEPRRPLIAANFYKSRSNGLYTLVKCSRYRWVAPSRLVRRAYLHTPEVSSRVPGLPKWNLYPLQMDSPYRQNTSSIFFV